LAACFGALISFVTNPLIYTGILILYQIADCIAGAFLQRAVSEAYKERKDKTGDAIYDYYLFRPHLLRLTFRLLGFFAAFTLALIGMYSSRPALNEFAWLAVVVTITATEILLHRWRTQRDRELARSKAFFLTAESSK